MSSDTPSNNTPAPVAPVLSKSVADKYDLTPGTPLVGHFPKFGELDFTIMDISQANRLAKDGFRWLKAKDAPEPPAKPEASAKKS